MNETRKSTTERAAHYTFGPRFFTEGEETLFEFMIDSGNKVGPRPATDADKAKHAEAWAKFNGDPIPEAAEPTEPEVVQAGRELARRRGGRPRKQ